MNDDTDELIHIGWVKRKDIDIVKEIVNKFDDIDIEIMITGGYFKRGEIVEKDYEEKEVIKKDEKYYGAIMNLSYSIPVENNSEII